MNFSQVYAKLNHKYQSQFNFHFSKCINQAVFNEVTAPSTISFKDAAIYAESIEYLKRQYYIINEIGIQEIFERIGMLAGFYASAVLLRFQYPMMIVTKTKDIFLKRLKRNKKIITEEGSSDESKSNTLSRSIELHTNTFLDSVNSSELSKKTAELRDQLFPEFRQKHNNDKSYDHSIHDIHNPLPSFDNSIVQKHESILSEESFADKLMKLSKNLSLNEMIDSEAIEVNLSPSQNDVNFLICDFDDIDKELTIQNYEKLNVKNNKENFGYQLNGLQEDGFPGERFRKKSRMSNNPIEQNVQYLNHQKTLQNPKYRRLPKQMQFSAIQKELKTRQMHPQQNNRLHPNPKMSAFYQTKNSMLIDTQSNRFNQHQQSYKTLQRFRTSNGPKANQHELKHIYNNMNNGSRQGYEGSRGKTNSYQETYLPRHRSNNIFNLKRPNDDLNEFQGASQKRNDYQAYIQQTDPFNHQKQSLFLNEQHQQARYNLNPTNSKYTNHTTHHPSQMNPPFILQIKPNDQRFVSQFDLADNQRINSPRFADLQEPPSQEQVKLSSIYSRHSNSNKLPTESKISHLPVTSQEKKYYMSPLERPLQSNINDNGKYRGSMDLQSQNALFSQQINPSASLLLLSQEQQYQQSLEDKQEKKKRIRQKAAQLLSRVKSQQYLTTRGDMMPMYTKRH